MRDIRALFTAEYLHSRVFKGIEEQTMNSEVKIIGKNRTQPRKKKVEESTPDSVLYI